MPWATLALCAMPAYADVAFVHTYPERAPATVVRCLEVCAACPVRIECLRSALEEAAFTPVGVWGGTTQTERRAALGRPPSDASGRRVPYDRDTIREAATTLEATLNARLDLWRARAARRAATPSATRPRTPRSPRRPGEGIDR